MIDLARDDGANSFPLHESFVDCCGVTREFVIDFSRSDDPRFLRAIEVSDDDGRYEFSAMSESDPYLALGKLRQIIRRELATRYLTSTAGRLDLSHDEARGRIAYGGVSIDGRFVSFAELTQLLDTYEGSRFSLRIVDPYDHG
jgi:hypothetical protein